MRRFAVASLLVATSAFGAPPAPGRYEATLCVTTAPAVVPSCGAARLELRAGGRAQIRVADIVYRLRLRATDLDVAATQGSMQIDEFSSPYDWRDGTLAFVDTDRGVRYEVRLGAKVRAPR